MNKKHFSLFIDNEEYFLQHDSILMGNNVDCDITLPKEISAFHQAIITISAQKSIIITPLPCGKPMHINGEVIINAQVLNMGDTLSINGVHGEILESSETFDFTFRNEHQVNDEEAFNTEEVSKIHIPQKHNESDVLIDDEYCDIVFEENTTTLNELSLHQISFNKDEYIDNIEFQDPFAVTKDDQERVIQITTAINGSILEQYDFPLKDGVISGSNRDKKGFVTIDLLEEKTMPLIQVKNGKIAAPQSDYFQLNQKTISFDSNDSLIMTKGIFQVYIQVTNREEKILNVSSFRRDKDFYKQTATKFFSVFLPLLFIMLVDYKVEEIKPKKKLAIIYKYKGETKKVTSENPSKNKNTGHKATKQPDKKVAKSKAGKPKKSPKKVKKIAKAKPTKNMKTVTKKVVKPKMKTYNFKMAANTNSVFSTTSKVAIKNSRSPSSINTSSSVSNMKTSLSSAASTAAIGNLGSDANGSAQSFGAKGLSSKKGRDTSSIRTKTVVLGSIDPELLRKILQQYLPQFRHCYQQELAYNSEDIKGIVDLNFEIAGTGKVGKVNIRAKDSRFSKKGINCMSKVLSVINFPKPKGGGRVAVRQPLNFYAESSKS